jgi:hypothetical protein
MHCLLTRFPSAAAKLQLFTAFYRATSSLARKLAFLRPCAETGFSDPFWRDVLLSESRSIAHDQRTMKGNNRVTFPKGQFALIGAILPQTTTIN